MFVSEIIHKYSNDDSFRDVSFIVDEPSCSDSGDTESVSGTRRARSATSTRISLFFGKVSQLLGNHYHFLVETLSFIVKQN